MQSNDQGVHGLCKSGAGRELFRAESCACIHPRSGGGGGRAGAESVGKLVATATTAAAKPSRRVEQPVSRTAAVAGQGQSALAVDDAPGALGRTAALYAMARHAAGTAAAAASALSAIQELAT